MIEGVVQFDLPPSDAAAPPRSVLPSFVIGPENLLVAPPLERLLHGHDLAAAAQRFNPLVLIGAAGSGKSQLAQGIVRHWSTQLDPAQVGYFTAVDFGRELHAAVAEGRLAAWRTMVRGLRVLVIEDIDRPRLHSAIQQDLRYAIDAVIEAGGLVVVTSKRQPCALAQFDAGLCDRLAAGYAVRLQRPGRAAREAIIRLAASAKRLPLTDDQIARLAQREAAASAELLGRGLSASSGSLSLVRGREAFAPG
ncbi:MAG: ATP-binding protein, partial [Pirellulales bacterium]|nr:ATP-binding protein [Pirellulales bacterium]